MLSLIGYEIVRRGVKAGIKATDSGINMIAGLGTMLIAPIALFVLLPSLLPIVVFYFFIPDPSFTSKKLFRYYYKYIDPKMSFMLLFGIPLIIFIGILLTGGISSIGIIVIGSLLYSSLVSIVLFLIYLRNKNEIKKMKKLSNIIEKAFKDVAYDINKIITNHYYSRDDKQLQKDLQPIIVKVIAAVKKHIDADEAALQEYIITFLNENIDKLVQINNSLRKNYKIYKYRKIFQDKIKKIEKKELKEKKSKKILSKEDINYAKSFLSNITFK